MFRPRDEKHLDYGRNNVGDDSSEKAGERAGDTKKTAVQPMSLQERDA